MPSQEVIELTSDEDDLEIVATLNKGKGKAICRGSPNPDSDDDLPSVDDILKDKNNSASVWRSAPSYLSSPPALQSSQATSTTRTSDYYSQASTVYLNRTMSRSSLLDEIDRGMNALPSLSSQASGTSNSPKKRKRGSDEENTQGFRMTKKQKEAEAVAERKAVREREAEKKKEAAALKKQEKEKEKAAKAAAKLREAEKKEEAKISKQLNKLVTSKKDTLVDMVIEVAMPLCGDKSPFKPISVQTKNIIVENSGQEFEKGVWPLAPAELPLDNMIRWRRHVSSVYDAETRQWKPCKPRDEHENAAMLFLIGPDTGKILEKRHLSDHIAQLRSELGKQAILILMIVDGPTGNDVEKRLAELMVTHRLKVVRAQGVEGAATWLYDITADFGIKPHKLIERTHLPFVGDLRLDAGVSSAGTFQKMLTQLAGISAETAKAITKQYPNMRSLMEAYDQHGPQGETLLAHITVERNKNGTVRARDTAHWALSQRVWKALTSSNPKEKLLGKDDD